MVNKMDNKGQSGQHKRLNANKKANTNLKSSMQSTSMSKEQPSKHGAHVTSGQKHKSTSRH